MNLFLVRAFLFFVGSVSGWVLELIFRRFFSDANPERKWINPGFCTGPYLPLGLIPAIVAYAMIGEYAAQPVSPNSSLLSVFRLVYNLPADCHFFVQT